MNRPSDAGQPRQFEDLQGNPREQIFCSRPREVADPIPVTLLEPIFAQFVDDCRCEDYELTDDDHAFAVELSHEMCKFQPSEPVRMDKFRKIFHAHGITLHAGTIGHSQVSTDGHLLDGTHVKVILEGKNEIGSGGAEPFLQSLLYYRKFLSFVEQDVFEEHKAILPCFHLVCAGKFTPTTLLLLEDFANRN
jgi:hypothetical protein